MQDTAKYLVHADLSASGVVERSDVVGAIFGQTEGLLGEDLDLRDLQQSGKVGRIDVEVGSREGESSGTVTIASGLDRVETAILAAALETIERVGPCRATFEIEGIEDVRAAKRREVVDRATDLLAEFDESVMTSEELIEAVRQRVRVEDITDYEGLPAGPRVADSDAIIVVEGRADVLTLLEYGVKNAVGVEGTDVPDAIAELTRERTVTAFLDGDRGGDLILKELAQVGSVDYVAFAPAGRSVEELSRGEAMTALREKVAYEEVADASAPREVAATDGSSRPAPSAPPGTGPATPDASGAGRDEAADDTETGDDEPAGSQADAGDASAEAEPETLAGHVDAVVGEGTGAVRLLDDAFGTLVEAPGGEAFDAVESAESVPAAVVLDGELSQRVLDVAAQRGVEQVVAREVGELVKRPTGVRIRTADQF